MTGTEEAAGAASAFHRVYRGVDVAREPIALGQPHRALRLIRQTRLQWVGDWPDELPVRTLVAAQALRALARPRQALELAKLVLETAPEEAARLIAELERELV